MKSDDSHGNTQVPSRQSFILFIIIFIIWLVDDGELMDSSLWRRNTHACRQKQHKQVRGIV